MKAFHLGLWIVVAIAPLASAEVSASLIATINNPLPAELSGFGLQLAMGDGYAVTRDGQYDAQQHVYVYSSQDGSFLRSFNVNSGYMTNSSYRAESLAISSGRLLVGASRGTPPVGDDTQLFDLQTGALLQTFIRPADADRFGYAVGYTGPYALVGDPVRDRVHVFDAVTGQQVTLLQPGTPRVGEVYGFGVDIAVSGNIAAVADPTRNSVYLYNTQNWQLIREIHRDDVPNAGWFGRSMDLHGGKLVVSAFQDSAFGPFNDAAFLYNLSNGDVFTLDDDFFGITGFDVEVSDGIAVVASKRWDSSFGQLAVFDTHTGALLEKMFHPSQSSVSYWGWSAALDGDRLLAGDYLHGFYDEDGRYQDRVGSMFLYSIPEPSSLVLLLAGATCSVTLRWLRECRGTGQIEINSLSQARMLGHTAIDSQSPSVIRLNPHSAAP